MHGRAELLALDVEPFVVSVGEARNWMAPSPAHEGPCSAPSAEPEQAGVRGEGAVGSIMERTVGPITICQEHRPFEWPRRTASTGRLTDAASCESFRLQLVELGLGDRSRVEELFGRRDLIGARAATARGDN